MQAIFVQKGVTKLTISLRAAFCWLVNLRWSYKKLKNGMYLDEHERPDVMEYNDEPRSQKWKKSLPISKGVGMQVEGV